MKAVVVGSGAGGAVAAREMAQNGIEVTILEAGKPFSPLTHKVSWLSSFRGSWLLKDENSIKRVFPHYAVTRASQDLVIFRGVTEGGCTPISTGNMARAENGLKEIGLDLSVEFEEIEKTLTIAPIPRERWRPLTQQMYDKAEQLGYTPNPTPKVDDLSKCIGCGYCEVGCITGAKWDSRRVYKDYLGQRHLAVDEYCSSKGAYGRQPRMRCFGFPWRVDRENQRRLSCLIGRRYRHSPDFARIQFTSKEQVVG